MAPIIAMQKVTKVFGGAVGSQKANVALDEFSLSVDSDFPYIITIAGESGSGKTTLMMLALAFYEPSVGRILYNGKDIWKRMTREETMDYRRNVQAVFQDPFAVYNPFYRVDNLLSIPIKNFKLAKTGEETQALMESALRRVGLRPDETLGRYPHQLSGGQRQRIAVARALILQPKLLIADEPVSMVDASLRATLLQNIRDMNQELRIPILYITHDLTTAYHVSDYIIVLYKGGVMEAGDVEHVIRAPKHPYTQLLVNSIPWPDPDHLWGEAAEAKRGGAGPVGPGCRFADRCPHAFDKCWQEKPDLYRTNGSQVASCFLYQTNEKLERDQLGSLFAK